MKARYFVFTLFFFSCFSSAATLDDVAQSLVADIQQAKKKLAQEQATITQQQSKLVDRVHKNVSQVTQLRAEAAAATRQQDDQLLDIKQLSERLSEWQAQANYQQQVLLELQQMLDPNKQATFDSQFSAVQSMKELNDYISAQRSALYPSVEQGSIVLTNGEVVNAETLHLGPVTWFLSADKSASGLVDTTTDLPSVMLKATDAQHQQLQQIFSGQPATLFFDPTLEKLFKIEQNTESVADHLKKGGTWASPIILFALFALIIGLIKSVMLLRLPKLLPLFSERLSLIEKKGAVKQELTALQSQVKDAQHALINITLEHGVSQQRDDQLFAYLMGYRHRLERGIGAIALVASVSPLLGLLGTVSGMIETFRMMTLFGAGDPAAVSGGISEALVTTELGLIVAIPALIIHAALNRRVKTRCLALEAQAIQLSQLGSSPETSLESTKERAA